MRLELGDQVRCSDAEFGELRDVVVDPTTKRVTHLVVSPTHPEVMAARLVPIALVAAGDGTAITLRCSIDEAKDLETAQEVAYLRMGGYPVSDPDWDVGIEEVLASPLYEGTGFGTYPEDFGGPDAIVYDRVPKGEVEIRRASAVFSADGHHLGHVDGFLVDADGAVTHVVLERGHLWGLREVTIPIGAVTNIVSDDVTVALSKHEVGALPTVHVHRWGRDHSSSGS